jgi:hypothetical protein
MNDVKRPQWTEDEVLALPPGQEHDYFDRKSGAVLDDVQKFRSALARHASAFANSGGGSLILGMTDQAQFDGIEPMRSKGGSTREWIEQVLPHLLNYPLRDFRVHTVIPSVEASLIPKGREVIVIDVGDSSLAPHQAADTGTYYYRVGGHSKPATHFYLETLRSRLTAPALEVWLKSVQKVSAYRKQGKVFLVLAIVAGVRNVGRVAAFKWAVSMDSFDGRAIGRERAYNFDPGTFALKQGREGQIVTDRTILPSLNAEDRFLVELALDTVAPVGQAADAFIRELHELISERTSVTLRSISETSPGTPATFKMAGAVNFKVLADAADNAGDIG